MNLFFFQLLTSLIILPMWGQSLEEKTEEAYASYQLGERATDYQERKLAFNKALFLYHALEQEAPYSADLNQALADTYFQLGKYAWAILYYQRALKEDSQRNLVLPYLAQAQEKLGLSIAVNQTNKKNFFYLLSQQSYLLLGTIFITFIAFSCVIWLPFQWLRKLAMACTALLAFLLGNILFFYYSTPVEGILVKNTGFYRAPDWNQPQLKNQPLLAGSKVHILQMTTDENWLKIENADIVGYIPVDRLRPI